MTSLSPLYIPSSIQLPLPPIPLVNQSDPPLEQLYQQWSQANKFDDDNDVLLNKFYQSSEHPDRPNRNKNCKLHIGNLPLNIQEETLSRFFSKYGPIKDIKIIRKNSQGVSHLLLQYKQPLKDYCYGFVLMQEGDDAQHAVTDFKENPPASNWSVAFSKDKNDSEINGNQGQPKDTNKKKDDRIKRKEKSKERPKKQKPKNKDKKKKKSESSSSSDSSRGRSPKKGKNKKKRPSSSSDSSASKLPPRSALIKIEQQQPRNQDDYAGLVFMPPGELQSHLQQPNQVQRHPPQQQMVQRPTLYVREVFISGIPQNKTAPDIQRIFSNHGVIERVDIMPKQLVNYAYVKFKRIESVFQAIQAQSIIAQMLESNGQVKIYQSDPFRRLQIVGNAEDVEKDEEMLPTMFIGYPANTNYTVDEKFLKKLAERYGGPVKNIQHHMPDQPQLRSYILIDFAELRDCKKARRKFCRYKIQILGDKKCDVAILSTLPNSSHNKWPPQVYLPQQSIPQSMAHQYMLRPMGQIGTPQTMIPPPPPPQSFQNPNMGMYSFDGQPQMMYQPPLNSIMPNQMFPSNQIMNRQQQNQQQQLNQHQYRNPMSGAPAASPTQPPQQNQYYQQSTAPPPPPPQQQPSYSTQTTQQQQNNSYIQAYSTLEYLAPPNPQSLQQSNSKIDDSNNFIWSGYMIRGRQHKVAIDAKVIQNTMDLKKGMNVRELVNLPPNLEMSFKCTYQDALAKVYNQQSAVMIFTPNSDQEYPKFTEYVQYLKSKDRAGVIQTDDFTIYVIPPGVQAANQLYNASPHEMVAIYCSK